ncbi:nucleoside phosphorylase [Natronomonas salina]|uniref:nucleoside phosphorylase n=1 Tax=Natronomonas salina TaxID=1710540 RepID=UPI0015B76434|nr:nucleoside phosphorylase [Natronomonas salina]QLD89814.1 nucleoside phosphorylase [Natronomonas salina]
MPFPNHPDKHRAEAVLTPERFAEYRRSIVDGDVTEPPRSVVLCYSRSLMEYFTEAYDGREIGDYYGDLYAFDDSDGAVGVMGNFGIGAPTTAKLVGELVADGVETFLSIGFAGCLDESVEMGEFIVCEKAIRDEGTSHHYLEPERYAHPDESLVEETTRLLEVRDEPFQLGPSWTTDAVYRETVPEVERYADEGVLTVEMEASAVFAVATYHGVEAGAMFVASDYLGPSEWEPKFHLTEADMRRLGDTAKEVLESRVG